MNIAVVNRTIRAMCLEVKARGSCSPDWRLMAEDRLQYEVAICIFGSQILFEMAVAAADRLRERGLICAGLRGPQADEFRRQVINALAEPLPVIGSNTKERSSRVRFKNRLASLLTSTVVAIYGQSHSIKSILCAARGPNEARELLTRRVLGFGPKQASLFLRRIGYCADLAVLDVHVLDYLEMVRGIPFPPSKLGRLSFYEEVEEEFREIALSFGHSVGCVDLATWLTMRVAKREAFL